jgi:DNA-binding NarL/FixJ family response regulator
MAAVDRSEVRVKTLIRLLLVDDHTLFREGVKALLSTTEDIVVIGEAGDGASAIQQFQALHPQVVLMDISMPGKSGIEACQAITAEDSSAGVIMVTMQEDDASVFAAMRVGARGYVLKGANPQELLGVIRAVAQGQALFGPAIAIRMMRYFQEVKPDEASSARTDSARGVKTEAQESDLSELSGREGELLGLIAEGYSNNEIAQKLFISPKTVRNHITSIFSKLQVANRAQAIRRARSSDPG